MSPRTDGRLRSRALLWIPAVAVPAAIAAAVIVPMQASAAVDLPDKTVAELLEFASTSDVEAFSGTIEQTSELGIPDLAGLTGAMGGAGSGSADAGARGDDAAQPADLDDLISLATGSHTANVYVDGSLARLQVLDQLAERNVYVDGEAAEGWFVDSETKTATHVVLPEGTDPEQLGAEAEAHADVSAEEARARIEAETGAPLPTPEELLDRALASLDETTEVTVGTDARVAGREVYELVLEPRTDDTLVGSLRFAVDGENGMPLAASISARGADEPAFRVAFSEVSFEAPDTSVFEFAPSADFTVTEREIPIPTEQELAEWRAGLEAKAGGAHSGEQGVPSPIVHGDGWATVVELPLPSVDAEMLDSLTRAVDGARVLETSLLTVLITDDGRVLAGAVPVERLVEVAAAGAADTGR
ncbi:hypothetical protein GE115_04770 [Agromyces sp. CFH 90414]|uniref:DUF2092 domain-containing protein n=1 Tax=Agromyces agglutinans TaxID=2662258 RepID=A0A6I2FB73_9MICO|nr:hypothetical protein [Agromyces agglutinans]MRG59183.1 hypothetical protein [Agromyces agglutinans]